MLINQDFENQIRAKAKEMKGKGVDVDFLDIEKWGKAKVYLDKVPTYVLFQTKLDETDVYFGSDKQVRIGQ